MAVRHAGPDLDRSDFEEWKELCNWLDSSRDFLIVEAYKQRLFEHLFTLLEVAVLLRYEACLRWWQNSGSYTSSEDAQAALASALRQTEPYSKWRNRLRWALDWFFRRKHNEDLSRSGEKAWDTLRDFACKLRSGDVVITFNYDATIERALLKQGRWSPSDGYAYGRDSEGRQWKLTFQQSICNAAPVKLPRSEVKVLHLHGAIGWHDRRKRAPGQPDPAPAEGLLSLHPEFLTSLGLNYVDSSMPSAAMSERPILLHPSFIKDYGADWTPGGQQIFHEIWRWAAKALREADRIFVIAYSLPAADSAALTLFQTNADRERVQVVNLDPNAAGRLSKLLTSTRQQPQSLREFVSSSP